MSVHRAIDLPVECATRRSRPRWTDTDWLVLTRLSRAIEQMAGRHCRAGMVALDLGCGSRPYEPIFRKLGAAYLGADLDDDAELRIGASGRVEADDAMADMLLSFQVLEHVRDLDTYLTEARRLLKRDGTLLLSTHGTWLYHPHPEDHRRWTREGLRTDVEARGFEMLECAPIVGPLAWTTLVRLTSFAFALRKLPVIGKPLAALLAIAMNARAVVEDKVTPAWVAADNACVYLIRCRRL